MVKVPYEIVVGIVDEFFNDLATTFTNDGNLQCIIDTRDNDKLSRFYNKRMIDYLCPGSAGDELVLKQIGSYQIISENDFNTNLRTSEMFFELEMSQAKEYQSYFTEFRENTEHLLYYTCLQDWINYLQEQFDQFKINEGISMRQINRLKL